MMPELCYFSAPATEHCPSHRIAVWQRGDAANPRVVFCVHGLTRNGRDFDDLAEALSADFRILCPDMPGRGKSDALPAPALYHNGMYLADLLFLMDHLDLARCGWVGTSMGGILGMMLAAKVPERIERLVLNDIGALIPAAGLKRIGGYVGKTRFASRAEAESALRANCAPYGIPDEAHWQHLFAHSLRDLPGGAVELAYDPAIGRAFADSGEIKDINLWELWNQTVCPTLILRGERSDILPRAVAESMTHSRSHVELREIPGTGHAPALMSLKEIAMVRDFLLYKK